MVIIIISYKTCDLKRKCNHKNCLITSQLCLYVSDMIVHTVLCLPLCRLNNSPHNSIHRRCRQPMTRHRSAFTHRENAKRRQQQRPDRSACLLWGQRPDGGVWCRTAAVRPKLKAGQRGTASDKRDFWQGNEARRRGGIRALSVGKAADISTVSRSKRAELLIAWHQPGSRCNRRPRWRQRHIRRQPRFASTSRKIWGGACSCMFIFYQKWREKAVDRPTPEPELYSWVQTPITGVKQIRCRIPYRSKCTNSGEIFIYKRKSRVHG